MNYESTIKPGLQPAPDSSFDEEVFGAAAAPRRGRGLMIVAAVLIVLALGLAWFFMHSAPATEASGAAKAAQAQSISVIMPGRTSVIGSRKSVV